MKSAIIVGRHLGASVVGWLKDLTGRIFERCLCHRGTRTAGDAPHPTVRATPSDRRLGTVNKFQHSYRGDSAFVVHACFGEILLSTRSLRTAVVYLSRRLDCGREDHC